MHLLWQWFFISKLAFVEKLHLLQKHQGFLSQRIGLMQSDAIDADILAETARAELGLYAPNDVIITIDLSNLKFSEDILNWLVNWKIVYLQKT